MDLNNFKLHQLPGPLKKLCAAFTVVLAAGVITGLIYLSTTSGTSSTTITERYNGSAVNPADEFDIPEAYPKPVGELLVTTHGHLIQFALIYFLAGLLFYFNSVVGGFWRTFLMVEPMFSSLFTFGGIWAMRFWHPGFVYVVMLSGFLMYVCYFAMVGITLWELWGVKPPQSSKSPD